MALHQPAKHWGELLNVFFQYQPYGKKKLKMDKLQAVNPDRQTDRQTAIFSQFKNESHVNKGALHAAISQKVTRRKKSIASWLTDK